MKLITTLSALLFTACTIPGLHASSTFSGSTSSPAPAAAAPAAAQPAPAPVAVASQKAAPPPELEKGDLDVFETAQWYVAAIDAGTFTPGHGQKHQGDELAGDVRDCSERVQDLLAHGFAPTTQITLKEKSFELDHVDVEVCQALASRIKDWDARGVAALAARDDAALEPYRKAGIAGDKLKLVSDLGQQLIGPDQASVTPAVIAHASALFSLRHDDYRVWTIVRYAFAGNKQVSVTEKGYHDRPGPEQFR